MCLVLSPPVSPFGTGVTGFGVRCDKESGGTDAVSSYYKTYAAYLAVVQSGISSGAWRGGQNYGDVKRQVVGVSEGVCDKRDGVVCVGQSRGLAQGVGESARVSELESDVGVETSSGAAVDTGEVSDVDVACEGSAVEVVERGSSYLRNLALRAKSKRRKARRKAEAVDRGAGDDKRGVLQISLEGKWQAENELRKFEAERKLRLLQAQEESDIVKMQRAQVMRTTETCKVQTEKAFGTLRRTGNMGSVETVVSTPSMTNGSTARSNGESVSPDSSISQSEIRQMQKEIIDLKREGKLAEKAFAKLAQIDARAVEMAREQAGIKTAFTVDTEGEPPINAFGEMRADGKFHTREVTTCHASNPCYKQKYEVWDEQQRELEQRLADLGI